MSFPPKNSLSARRFSALFNAMTSIAMVVFLIFNQSSAFAADTLKPPTALLQKYCGDCHTQGEMEGSLALDEMLKAVDPATERPKWMAVWKNLRSQLMPPSDQPQPTTAEKQQIQTWIEQAVFQLDPEHPDPGRVTVRRLNRNEYRNTIRDLFGIDYNTLDAFPADDTGYGFDTIGDVLSLSPLQVEKYLEAAREITEKVVPLDPPKPPTITIYPDNFRDPDNEKRNGRWVSFAANATVQRKQWIEHPGPYRLTLEYKVNGNEKARSQQGRLTVRIDGKDVEQSNLKWNNNSLQAVGFNARLDKGHHLIEVTVETEKKEEKDEESLALQMQKLTIYGPVDGSRNEYSAAYKKIFPKGPPPEGMEARREYAREVLRPLLDRIYRRPVDEPTLERLVALVERTDDKQVPMSFERGVANALTASLASPRFLFRSEFQPEPDNRGKVVPVDEFSLASRLSYFFWSSLPDPELFQLAKEGKLRSQLRPQVDRMLSDDKADRFVRSFVGQWLQSRDVETISIDARRILKLRRTEEAFALFTRGLRRAMREETEMLFNHILQENRSVLEMLTADYTFLNETLANWYEIPGVKGNEMRMVKIPEDSPRGGILSQGTFLIVTSNPTRTSPVKRGLFILDNLLGTPAPPPPPNIPPLEESQDKSATLSMRELMARHRADPLCASCHNRMDPLGLALEKYNAVGQWRQEENGEPIEIAGQLITGEKFNTVRELSQVIATQRRGDFYHCLAEKMFTYALGRGVEYYDTPTLEKIVADLEHDSGKIRTLIYGIVESAPFQLRRGEGVD